MNYKIEVEEKRRSVGRTEALDVHLATDQVQETTNVDSGWVMLSEMDIWSDDESVEQLQNELNIKDFDSVHICSLQVKKLNELQYSLQGHPALSLMFLNASTMTSSPLEVCESQENNNRAHNTTTHNTHHDITNNNTCDVNITRDSTNVTNTNTYDTKCRKSTKTQSNQHAQPRDTCNCSTPPFDTSQYRICDDNFSGRNRRPSGDRVAQERTRGPRRKIRGKVRVAKREGFDGLLQCMLASGAAASTPLRDDLQRIPLPTLLNVASLPIYPLSHEVSCVINKQLGRVPQGILGVARFSKVTGEPSVIVVAPVVDSHVFPTTFWLCDRALQIFIGTLERDGWIKKLQRQIGADFEKTEELIEDSVRYIRRRLSYLTPDMINSLKARGGSLEACALLRRGVGGVLNFQMIRCLHMHYAMHLVEPQGGLVGRTLQREFSQLIDMS